MKAVNKKKRKKKIEAFEERRRIDEITVIVLKQQHPGNKDKPHIGDSSWRCDRAHVSAIQGQDPPKQRGRPGKSARFPSALRRQRDVRGTMTLFLLIRGSFAERERTPPSTFLPPAVMRFPYLCWLVEGLTLPASFLADHKDAENYLKAPYNNRRNSKDTSASVFIVWCMLRKFPSLKGLDQIDQQMDPPVSNPHL